MRKLAMTVAALVIGLPALAVAGHPDCEAARCAVQAAIAAKCPCEGATNHGRYVSCVAHVVKQLSQDGTVPTNCNGKVVRCSAKSICGKAGFVTCEIPTDSCNVTTGFCTNSPTIACLTNLDCGARCKVSSSADRCTARGGIVGTSSNCCANCASPNGAFVDGQF
jgi:hypothetical protein